MVMREGTGAQVAQFARRAHCWLLFPRPHMFVLFQVASVSAFPLCGCEGREGEQHSWTVGLPGCRLSSVGLPREQVALGGPGVAVVCFWAFTLSKHTSR